MIAAAASAALLAHCAGLIGTEEAPPAAAPVPPSDYQRVIADNVPGQFKDKSLLAGAQVSPLRAAVAPQRGDWMACLKMGGGGEPAFYAVLIQDGKILELRRAVGIDRCEAESYAPLSPPPPLKPPAPPPKQKPDGKQPKG